MGEKKWILKEMKKAKQKGIDIIIDGKPYNFETKEKAKSVLESSVYMEDFVLNKEGKVVEIAFNKIIDN